MELDDTLSDYYSELVSHHVKLDSGIISAYSINGPELGILFVNQDTDSDEIMPLSFIDPIYGKIILIEITPKEFSQLNIKLFLPNGWTLGYKIYEKNG